MYLKCIQIARGLREPDSASRFYLDVINKQSCQENKMIQNTPESEGNQQLKGQLSESSEPNMQWQMELKMFVNIILMICLCWSEAK